MSASPILPKPVRHTLGFMRGRAERLQHNDGGVRAAGDTIAVRAPEAPAELRQLAGAATAGAASNTVRRSELIHALLARIPLADREAARTAVPAILDAARKSGNSDPNQIGYLLATAQTESDFGANMVETGHPKEWFDRTYGGEDGNRPGSSDGYVYRGRGYVQTTHAGRYAEMSHRLGLPDEPARDHGKPILDRHGRYHMEPALIANPDALAEPALAAQALAVGVRFNMFTHDPAAAIEKTIPAGKQPGDVDFYHARAIVNGIVKIQAQSIATHATTYAEILDGYRHSVLGAPGAR